jgi:Fe2+ or Zn2+ uptake regulation protein
MGVVQEAILAVLAESSDVLRPRDVHDRVQRRVGCDLSYDTVASFLSVARRATATCQSRGLLVRATPARKPA